MNSFNEHKEVIERLQTLKKIKPSRELVLRFDKILSSAHLRQDNQNFSLFPRIALVSLAVFLLGGLGIVRAAEGTSPGSFLYPVKEAVQKAKIVLSKNPSARALLHLEEAESSLSEIEKSVESKNNERLEKSVDKYEEHVGHVRRETQSPQQQSGSSVKVEEAIGNQAEKLKSLGESVPVQAQSALERALEASQKGRGDVRGSQNTNNNLSGQIEGSNPASNNNSNNDKEDRRGR
jgi:hypothetical protein